MLPSLRRLSLRLVGPRPTPSEFDHWTPSSAKCPVQSPGGDRWLGPSRPSLPRVRRAFGSASSPRAGGGTTRLSALRRRSRVATARRRGRRAARRAPRRPRRRQAGAARGGSSRTHAAARRIRSALARLRSNGATRIQSACSPQRSRRTDRPGEGKPSRPSMSRPPDPHQQRRNHFLILMVDEADSRPLELRDSAHLTAAVSQRPELNRATASDPPEQYRGDAGTLDRKVAAFEAVPVRPAEVSDRRPDTRFTS